MRERRCNPHRMHRTDSTKRNRRFALSDHSVAELIDPLKDLEPTRHPLQEQPPVEPPPGEHKGLEWYLKARGRRATAGICLGSVDRCTTAPPRGATPEFLGYDQSPSPPRAGSASTNCRATSVRVRQPCREFRASRSFPLLQTIAPSRPKDAVTLRPRKSSNRRRRPGCAGYRGSAAGSLASSSGRTMVARSAHPSRLAESAAGNHRVAGPHDPRKLWSSWRRIQASGTLKISLTRRRIHRRFSVVPVIDPTAKKPAPDATATEPVTVRPETSPTTAPDAAQPALRQAEATSQHQRSPFTCTCGVSASQHRSRVHRTSVTNVHRHSGPVHPHSATTSSYAPRQPSPYVPATTKVPSSLQSQMVTMTPEASGNKPARGRSSRDRAGRRSRVDRARSAHRPAPARVSGQCSREAGDGRHCRFSLDGTAWYRTRSSCRARWPSLGRPSTASSSGSSSRTP